MGGSPSGNTTQTVIQQQQLPEWYQNQLQNLIGRANSESSAEAPVYGGQRVAGLNALQNSALNSTWNLPNTYQPWYDQATNMITNSGYGSAGQAAQGAFDAAGAYGARGAGADILGAASPYLQQARGLVGQGTGQNILGIANPYIQQGVSGLGLQAASPFLQKASGDLGQATQNALSPYLGGALNALSDQASYDLKNKYLPAVNDSFIRAGQFGSTRNQDITAQTIHDLSNTVQQNQAGLINQAYGQAQNAAGQNLALQGQLGQTAGALGTQQQQALLQAGQTLGSLGGQQGQLALQGAQAATGIGSTAANALQNYAQNQLNAAQLANQTGSAMGNLAATDLQRQLQAGIASQNLGTAQQQAGINTTNAQYAAGQAFQNQDQKNLDTAYQDWLNQAFYPQNQTSWLSSIVRGLPTGAGSQTMYQNPTNPGAQIGGLLTSALSLYGGGGQGQGAGQMGGYYKKGGRVKKKMGIGRAA